MKRTGFTMVELIFVIIIIGILSAAAIPKFGDMKDRAKANSEVSALSSLDGAIAAAIEGRFEDYGDTKVNWHNYEEMNTTDTGTTRSTHFSTINDSRNVLSSILKKGKNLKIIGYLPANAADQYSYNDGLYNNVLIITGDASNAQAGVKPPVDAPGNDINGKPDRNDFWVFNPTGVDLVVTSTSNRWLPVNKTIAAARSITLVDVNGTNANASYIRNAVFNGFTNDLPTTQRRVILVN